MSHKSEIAGPFNRGDTIMNKHFTLLLLRNKKFVIRDGVALATTLSGSSRFHFNGCILLYFFSIVQQLTMSCLI